MAAAAPPVTVTAAPAPEPGSWPIFRGDVGLTGVAEGVLPDELTLRWTYTADGAITSSPVVSEGRVFFGSDDGKLHCVELETGAP